MEVMMSDLAGPKDDGRHLSLSTESISPLVQMVLPLLQNLDPARVNAIKHGFLQLSVLQSESVSLTMPVMTLTP